MALPTFQWSGNQAISTPEAAERRRRVAEAMIGQAATPASNWAEGLSDVAAAFTGTQLQNQAAAAEEAGRASAAQALAGLGPNAGFSDIAGALSNPWLSQPQSTIAAALLQQNLQSQDPAYQLDLDMKRAQLAQLQDPQSADPTSGMQNYNFLLSQGYDPQEAAGMSFGAGGTTVNNMGNIPAGYQIVQDPATGATRMEPIPGSPAALEMEQAAAKAGTRAAGMDTVTDTIVSEAQKAREAAQGFGATGVGNFLTGGMGFTPAAQVNQHVDSLKAIASSENINAMRQASPTGGALGNTSDADLKLLQNKAGALNPQSPTFDRDLADYERTLLRIVHGPEAGDQLFQATRPQGSAPSIGSVEDGYRFRGGNPADRNNWEQVR